MTDERKFGKVKHWNANSAYGFIAEDGRSKQHFFHVRDIVTPARALSFGFDAFNEHGAFMGTWPTKERARKALDGEPLKCEHCTH